MFLRFNSLPHTLTLSVAVKPSSWTHSMINGSSNTERKQSRSLLLGDNGIREQLLSELSLLLDPGTKMFPLVEATGGELNLRLVIHMVEMVSMYPALGSLFVVSPRRVDDLMKETLTEWLEHEAAVSAVVEGGKWACKSCHHAVDPVLNQISPVERCPREAAFPCSICVHTTQWPAAFWDLVRAGRMRVAVRTASDGLPSFLQLQHVSSAWSRPRDISIGNGGWSQVIGYITAVFFGHRDSTDPKPIAELQPQISNRTGMFGQQPLWLDLSLIPHLEMKEVTVVGERVHVVGLMETAMGSRGRAIYSKKGCEPSPVGVILEARFVRTATFVSQWSCQSLIAEEAAAPWYSTGPSVSIETAAASECYEGWAASQAGHCWECVAGAAACATTRVGGGFRRVQREPRMELTLGALDAFMLPTSLWAAIGTIFASSRLRDSGIAATVVGPTGVLASLEAFLLEVGEETNFVLPVVHGSERGLLPSYARVPVDQAMIPAEEGVGSYVELIRGGVINAAQQRVLFVPSLQSITSSALNAMQSAFERREHVVVREGGQVVKCRTASALLGVTQESILLQQRHLFQFLEKGDFVFHIPQTSFRPIQEQAGTLFEILREDSGPTNAMTLKLFERCSSQWNILSNWVLIPSVHEPTMPQMSPPCSVLLHAYFLAAKAVCARGVDVGMMGTLVKLTCAHASLRRINLTQNMHRSCRSTEANSYGFKNDASMDAYSTALIDAIVAIELCDASLKFMAGVSLIGGTSVFELIPNDTQFDVVQYARDLHLHLQSSLPPDAR